MPCCMSPHDELSLRVMSDILSGENRAPTSDEVFLNIKDLQPNEYLVLPRRGFELLRNTLTESFTETQLQSIYP
jgi:hypothetical protein